jgi:AraC-like DNA-binding protein
MRQSFDPGPGIAVSSLAYEYPPAWRVPEHSHASDQLIYATSGVMEVAAAQTQWLIPPQFAAWIPANVRHSIRMPGAVSMRTLYIRPGLARDQQCAVLHVSDLLRELIVEAVRLGKLKMRDKADSALRDVLVAQINKASAVPTQLAMPKDSRVRALAEAVMASPRQAVALDLQCRKFGISLRTMQRLFRREVGTDFETWRRQARLMKAVEFLAAGRSIKETAFAVGYRQASTFVEMFRRSLGVTPKVWISALTSPAKKVGPTARR